MVDSIFNVPELVDMLVVLLEPKDLVSCLQVCSTWHSAFAPNVWRNFDDSTGMWNNEILRKSSHDRNQDWVNSVFSRYGHLIRHGTFSWFGTMQAARDHCHDLVSLDLRPGSRITEVQADVIHDQRREERRLQHLVNESKRLKMEAARAKHVADGRPLYTFRWNSETEEAFEVNVNPAQAPFWAAFPPNPVEVTIRPIPEYHKNEIWGPTNGEVDVQEIQACIDLLRTNPGLQKLVTIRFEEASEELQQSLENALSSMAHLVEAHISLNASQIARLNVLLPKVEILNVATQSTVNYGHAFFNQPVKKPPVGRDAKMDKNHPLLRSLVLGDQFTFVGQMGALLDHCPRLETLSVSSFAFSTPESISENASAPAPQGQIFGPFNSVHGMLRESATTQEQRSSPKPDRPLFANAFKKHTALKDLELSVSNSTDWLGALLERFPRLENLKLTGRKAHRSHGLKENLFDAGQSFVVRSTRDQRLNHPAHHYLKSLTVQCAFDMNQLIQDLHHCRVLESLFLNFLDLKTPFIEPAEVHQNDDIERCSNLRSLVIDFDVQKEQNFHYPRMTEDRNNDHDRAMAALLKKTPNLESFKCQTLGLLSTRALSKYCNAHLKEVDLDESYVWYLERKIFYPGIGLGSEVASRLLSSCPNLETFLGLYYTVHAEQIAQYPWVCRNLKKLRTQIVGVPRLSRDQHDKVKDRLAGGVALPEPSAEDQAILDQHERCRKLQRTVFDQLSRMTELTHLDLGFENRYPWEYKSCDNTIEEDGVEYIIYADPFPDTLELTLEAGFGQLVTLQKLETFGFESVDHRMQIQECQWMAENWPNLKLMYGLAKTLFYDDKPDHHGNAMRAWMETARPDIVHSTLFSNNA